MKILFTGASSFTGYWMVRELAAAGHEVHATLTRAVEAYDGVRGDRVRALQGFCTLHSETRFGDDSFLALAHHNGPWDMLCHHAADVTNYKSPDFDVLGAVANNTYRIEEALKAVSAKHMLITGSVFEGREGVGSEPMQAFSPYGLSKELTHRYCAYHCSIQGIHLGKFVIPNPFGPFEEPRFTAYLMRSWSEGKTASVQTPAYLRDNIHVTLLAKAYVRFVEEFRLSQKNLHCHPSGYVETQGAFAQRFAREVGARMGWDCRLELAEQKEFPEPRVRVNREPCDADHLGWTEKEAWRELAEYYQGLFSPVCS